MSTPGENLNLSEDDRARLAIVQSALQTRQGETEVEKRLDATLRACELLGDIHKAAPVIMVAGTNGKTSTVRMIDALLTAHGLRTGRFTSPHMHALTERISVDGEQVSVDTFVRVYSEIAPILDLVDAELREDNRPPLTYFEALTVLAYAVFADAPVDVNVIEVGMGGEWDSTNVADAHVCVFTPVGLDHTAYLGTDTYHIASTKAGILNRTSHPSPAPHPVAIVGKQDEGASVAFAEQIAARNVDARLYGRDFACVARTRAVDGQVINLEAAYAGYADLFVPLHGAHQAENAAMALAAVEAFLATPDTPLKQETVQEGFSSITSPGRAEILRTDPTVLVDGAHNPQGAEVLAATIADAFDFAYVVAIVAMYEDKDPHGIFEFISRYANEIIVTEVQNNPRARSADELAEAAREWWDEDNVKTAANMNDAFMTAFDLVADSPGAAIVATGSLATVAEARTLLGRKGE